MGETSRRKLQKLVAVANNLDYMSTRRVDRRRKSNCQRFIG
jgi:hypothetical protein